MTEVRIACSLEPAQATDRRAVWQQLADRALRERRPTVDGVQLVYAAHDGVEGQLRQLAELERACCSFAAWQVYQRDGAVVLQVTATGDGIAAVRALFELT